MEIFLDFLEHIDNTYNRERTKEILTWVQEKFVKLVPKVAWNQPMFTDHGTFIIGFSVSKNHLSISPETAGIAQFSNEIVVAGYDHSKNLLRIKWDSSVDYALLEKIIEFNICQKAKCSSFWRKETIT